MQKEYVPKAPNSEKKEVFEEKTFESKEYEDFGQYEKKKEYKKGIDKKIFQ